MSVKQKDLEKYKQHEVDQQVIDALSQIDLGSMSLMSLLQLGGGLVLKHAIAAEITEYLGRSRYQRTENFKGYRNGTQDTNFDTPLGSVRYDRPKVAGAPDFKSRFHTPRMKRPEEFANSVTDMFINGISTRKIKDSLRAVAGEKVRLSRSSVSRITKRLRNEFATWKDRSLSEVKAAYLFLDAIRVGMRMGGTSKDAVLLAYAILEDGTMELLAIDIGNAESDRSWGKFVEKLKARGLADPLLVCSDGNQGVINAIDAHFTTSYRQRCLKHREQNILDAVPKEEQGPVKKALKTIFYGATSLSQAKQFVASFKRDFQKTYPTAVERLYADLDQCLVFYMFPHHHWKRMRTSNKLERLNRELRRRLDVIGRHPDENGCLSLIYAVTTKYAANQNGFKVDDLTKELWTRLREKKIEMIEQLELDLWVA
jgi:putative transposase